VRCVINMVRRGRLVMLHVVY